MYGACSVLCFHYKMKNTMTVLIYFSTVQSKLLFPLYLYVTVCTNQVYSPVSTLFRKVVLNLFNTICVNLRHFSFGIYCSFYICLYF
ncbi:hypothetical protein BDF14DRAFT_1832601 [Spinellus fusiger]|nr:hypothetical protein BDF14DRAFT_1832601 [Spinellus fusiger]